MVLWLVKFAFCCRRAAGDFTPRQLALGCALGLILGLVPKGNLLALAIATLVCSLRLNLLAAMLSTLVFSFLAPWLDPVTHVIGLAVLGNDSLTDHWRALYQYPLAPWTSFNNTVVLGSLLLGGGISVPFYLLVKFLCGQLRRPASPQPSDTALATN